MGVLILPPGLRKPEINEIPYAIMAKIIDFAAIAQIRQMGLHCAICGKDFTASNDEHAPIYVIKCGCREFWSTNPKAGKTH